MPNVLFIKLQDERYSKYIGHMAIVPMTFGRHVPILSDKVWMSQSVHFGYCNVAWIQIELFTFKLLWEIQVLEIPTV